MTRKHSRSRIALTTIALLIMLSAGMFAFPTNAQLSYDQLILSHSPSRYFRLSETSGTTAINATGGVTASYFASPVLGLQGIPSYDSNYAIGTFGSALLNIGSVTWSGSYAIEGWIKLASPISNAEGSLFYPGAVTPIWYCQFKGTGSPVRWEFRFSIGTATYITNIGFSSLVWHHVVCQFDSATGRGQAYIDGNLIYNISATGMTGTGNMTMFDWYLPDTASMTADEAAIYTHSLTAPQIIAHYQSGIASTYLTPSPTHTIAPTNTPANLTYIATLPGSHQAYAVDFTFSAGEVLVVTFLVIVACLLFFQLIMGVVQWLRK